MANALVKLATAEYDTACVGKEPTNLRISKYGYLPERRTAWFSRDALASLIRSDASMTVPANPRLLLDSGRNFYKNTTQFGIAGYDDAVARRESVLHEADTNGFREHFGRSSRLPRWQGRVIAAHGVPPNVSWIAIADDFSPFALGPEERAVECAGTLRQYPAPTTLSWALDASSPDEVYQAASYGDDFFYRYAMRTWPAVARARGAERVTVDGETVRARIRLDGWKDVVFRCLSGPALKAASLLHQFEEVWAAEPRCDALVLCADATWDSLREVVRRVVARRPALLPVYVLDVDNLIEYVRQQPWCDYEEFADFGIIGASDESFSEQLAFVIIAVHIAKGGSTAPYNAVKEAFRQLNCGDFFRALQHLSRSSLLFRDGDAIRGPIFGIAEHEYFPAWYEVTKAKIFSTR